MSWDSFVGKKLADGWTVKEKVVRDKNQTGGNFGICFLVEKTEAGKTEAAFLKAFDFEKIFVNAGGNLASVQRHLESVNFEAKLLELCRSAHVNSVVTAISQGEILIPGVNLGQPVKYLIFQLAQQDLRKFHHYANQVNALANITVLRGAANGLRELHSLQISHQDLKPSNVLVYEKLQSKIADLGRSCKHGDHVWHDGLLFAGDMTYAPPEVHYKYEITDWHIRRFSQDLYMLGSLIVFLFSSVNVTSQVLDGIAPSFHPKNWGDGYAQVLPYWRSAFNFIVKDLDFGVSAPIAEELRRVVLELCEPDPLRRGSPRITNLPARLSLQRYVSIFDRLIIRVRLSA